MREQSQAMKIYFDYHVYSKQGSYATPYAIIISDLLFHLMFTREKRRREVREMFLVVVHCLVFTSNESLSRQMQLFLWTLKIWTNNWMTRLLLFDCLAGLIKRLYCHSKTCCLKHSLHPLSFSWFGRHFHTALVPISSSLEDKEDRGHQYCK